MLVDRPDIIHNIPMRNGNVRIAVQPDKDRAGSEGVARVSGVADRAGSIDGSTSLEGRGRRGSDGLGVRLKVRIPFLRGVRLTGSVGWGASSAPRLKVGFRFTVVR